MSTATPLRASSIPITDPATARIHSEAEYAALVGQVEQFTPDDWVRPTDCAGWTPREMAAHLAGAAEAAVRWRKTFKHSGTAVLRARRGPLEVVDYMCASQIHERRHLDPAGLPADLRRWAALAPAKNEAKPGLVRRIPLPLSAGLPAGATFAYLIDVINTRDIWLHRIDLARATGRPRIATPAEAEVVRQVMRDLDGQWTGDAVDITLTGPGGGMWRIGDGEPAASVREDAIAFMRLLSGRSDECTFAVDGDPSIAQALRAQRVIFCVQVAHVRELASTAQRRAARRSCTDLSRDLCRRRWESSDVPCEGRQERLALERRAP